jgi:UDP-glucose 6-dehydrogenase
VIGVDVNRHSVDSCNRGVPPIQEPGIEDLYRSCHGLLTATTDSASAVARSEATLICVPTPSDPDGGYSLRYVLEACKAIGDALRNKNSYHLVVLKSTVLPVPATAILFPHWKPGAENDAGVISALL